MTHHAVPGGDSDSILSIEDLRVAFHGAAAPAVDGVSLTVRQGECLGIVGESGAGKSQTFLAALGLLASPARVEGRVRFGPQELLGLPERQLDQIRGAGIGLVFQDPMTSLTPHLRIGAQLSEPMVRHGVVRRFEAEGRALALLEQVRLPDAARRMRQYPHELSGGMRQRVMIAIALACGPKLVILDEPTTALDVTLQAQILQLLRSVLRERGVALVLITHDFGTVAGLADRVAVMRSGRVIEQGTVHQIMKAPVAPYTRGLLRSLSRSSDRDPAPAASPAGPAVLEVSDLAVEFTLSARWGRRLRWCALEGIRLTLDRGEALGVVGESGCGKSTLTRAVLQLIRPTAGRVVWMGRSAQKLSAREIRRLRRDLQIIFQDPLASLDPHLTVERIVAEPLAIHCPDLDAGQRRERVGQMLSRVGLGAEYLTRLPHELSGGQCQRVGIARAMILEPRLLVCDEPLSALDASTQAQVLELLGDLKRNGTTLLFVSHNLASVRHLCDRVLVLYLGRMAELASARRLFAAPLHPYTRELLAAIPVPDPDVQPARLAAVHVGEPPSPADLPSGCLFRTRCPRATSLCTEHAPAWRQAEGGWVACHHFDAPGG